MFDQFDPDLPPYIQGQITNVAVIDPAVTGVPGQLPNRVVDPSQPFTIQVDWTLTGALVPLWLNALQPPLQSGFWDVSAYAESLGGGNETKLGTDNTVQAVPGQNTYSATIVVPPNTLQEHNPGTDQGGIYKLAVAVFLNSNLGAPGFDIIGFQEGPIIQVENPL